MILNLCDYPFTLNNKPYSVAFFIHWLLCVCLCVSCSVMSDSMRPPSFSVHGILQARILEWIAVPSSRGSSPPRDWTQVSSLQVDSTIWPRRQWHPTPVLLPGKSHRWRSLVGCSPWCCRVGQDWATSLSGIGEGNGNPLQCSCLENPRDRGAWWVAVYGVSQSQTRLKWLSSSSSYHLNHKGSLWLVWTMFYNRAVE